MCGPHHCLGRDAFASGPEILRRLLQERQNASILEQGCAGFSPGSANRCNQFTRHPGRTSSPLRPCLSCRYTQRRVVSIEEVLESSLRLRSKDKLRLNAVTKRYGSLEALSSTDSVREGEFPV